MSTREDKIFVAKILADLRENGFVEGGKAEVMLSDWAKELRLGINFPRTKVRKTFNYA